MDYLYDVSDHDLHQIMDDDDDGNDSFYAELERRILLLINTADENENDNSTISSSKDYRTSHLDQNYFDWTETQNYSSLVPATILNLWRSNHHNVNGTGTGVFIPHMVKSKRKNKPRKKKIENGRATYQAKPKAVANKS